MIVFQKLTIYIIIILWEEEDMDITAFAEKISHILFLPSGPNGSRTRASS